MDARIFIAWHGLATIYYLIRRGRTEAAAMHEIDGILGWAEIAPVDSSTASRARSLDLPDFEDAMQCASAENCFADIIVTRNIKDFARSPIPAMTFLVSRLALAAIRRESRTTAAGSYLPGIDPTVY